MQCSVSMVTSPSYERMVPANLYMLEMAKVTQEKKENRGRMLYACYLQ